MINSKDTTFSSNNGADAASGEEGPKAQQSSASSHKGTKAKPTSEQSISASSTTVAPPNTNSHAADATITQETGQDTKTQLEASQTDVGNLSSRRARSLDLRKLPVDVLLRPAFPPLLLDDDELTLDGCTRNDANGRSCLRYTCLNSRFTLRAQMMLSFGVFSTCIIALVVVTCITVSLVSGRVIKDQASKSLEDLSRLLEGRAARYVAEELTPRLNLDDVVDLLAEATKDRFQGYPIYEDDSKVPFRDIFTNTSQYPIVSQKLPLDWQIEPNVNEENYQEHLQDRWFSEPERARISTSNAVYIMPGSCNPNTTDPTSAAYWQNCTKANNDISSGGIFPTPTSEQVHRKAASLTPLLKALYEYHQDITQIGVGFVNGGAGSLVHFPGSTIKPSARYRSVGCDHLKAPHPRNVSRSIMSDEEVERCEANSLRIKDAIIPARLFSPVDRAWFSLAVSAPSARPVASLGPLPFSLTERREWSIVVGRAIYDRTTDELIGVAGVAFGLAHIHRILLESKVSDNSHVSVVRLNDEGTVLGSTALNMATMNATTTISELNLGVSASDYQVLHDLVDFKKPWEAEHVRSTYEEYLHSQDGFNVKAYPIPPPPAFYDEHYRPEYLVIVSTAVKDVLIFAEEVEDNVDSRVTSLVWLSIVVGFLGWCAVIIMLFMVSHYITLPLREMNDIAMRIIDTFGDTDDSKIAVEDAALKTQKRVVKTELSEIVKEFQRMVSKFSGGALAKSTKIGMTEVENQFEMMEEFQQLYRNCENTNFKKTSVANVAENENTCNGDSDDPAAKVRVHFGSNITVANKSASVYSINDGILERSASDVFSSPLFKWIVVLIVLPLLLSTITVSAIVTANVSLELPGMINAAERGLVEMQFATLQVFARLRAGFVSKHSEQAIRDDYIHARYISWIMFGGLDMAGGLPETMVAGTEYCKVYDDFKNCPYFKDHNVCDCKWKDSPLCFDYNADIRHLQRTFVVGSAENLLSNGDRINTSYPKIATSQDTTEWLKDLLDPNVPGSPNYAQNVTRKTSPTSRGLYSTTYERMAIIASLPILQPLFNYHKRKDQIHNKFVAFEADGMLGGYSGCETVHVTASGFQSTVENGAAKLRRELCPLGKWGYDPRCRGWYDQGKKSWKREGKPVYVTPPYLFATKPVIVAQTITSSLIDPISNEQVGQTLLDFSSSSIFDAMNSTRTPLAEGGTPIIIAMKRDAFGSDTVLGPGHSLSDPSLPIEVVVRATDEYCDGTEGNCGFSAILKSMRAGNESTGKYFMEDARGFPITMYIAYAPVIVTSIRQVNSSDFSNGIEVVNLSLYSLALVEPEASMEVHFEKSEEEIEQVYEIGLAILAALMVVAICVIIFLSHRITVSLTEPMYYLLILIQQINRLDIGEDLPESRVGNAYGSLEVLNVKNTMERLYRTIQCANTAYFSGEVEVAYEVFKDALQLFTRLDNQKAMGVASNNLGVCMLTLFRKMGAEADTIAGMNRMQIIGLGMSHFHQAIQLGEKAYDKFYETEGWSPNCLDFMQHLSNRYFNRAMFLLTVKDSHERPNEIMELGMRDLTVARDMDVEIVDEGTQVGWDVRTAEAQFEILLCRICGHNTLLEMGYADDWELDKMLETALKLVQSESKKETSHLFAKISPVGRLQQVECELMRYRMAKQNILAAAQIGIRMVVEDEYTLSEAHKMAVEVLLEYCVVTNASLEVQQKLERYKHWLSKLCNRAYLSVRDTGSIISFASSRLFKKTMESIKSLEEAASSGNSLKEILRGDVTMETF